MRVLVNQLYPTLWDPWTIAHQAPLSMEFSRQAYWSGLPFPSPGDLLSQGLNSHHQHCRQILYHLSHQGSPMKGWREISSFPVSWESWAHPWDGWMPRMPGSFLPRLEGAAGLRVPKSGSRRWAALGGGKTKETICEQSTAVCLFILHQKINRCISLWR